MLVGRSTVRGLNGAVASGQPLASLIGIDVLREGGNAADATLAMAAALCVLEPLATGLGGDCFALVYFRRDKTMRALNASGPAIGSALNVWQPGRRLPDRGIDSITVPGAASGWQALHAEYCSMPLPRLLAPAIDLAEKGCVIMEKTARDWGRSAARLDEPAGTLYLPRGVAPNAGQVVRSEPMARTLRMLAHDGCESFYTGKLGTSVLRSLQAQGSPIEAADMERVRAEWVEDVSRPYRDVVVHACPPNSQGITTLMALQVLESFDLTALREQADAYLHVLAEAIKLAMEDRDAHIADPVFAPLSTARLLSREHAAARRALIRSDRARPAQLREHGRDTTCLAVFDRWGNSVSFMQSLYEEFGAGIVAGDTGLLLHNRAGGFCMEEGHPNYPAPGKRPFHTLSPAMLSRDGRVVLSFGVMGGHMQCQGQVQILARLLHGDMDLQAAIDSPRFMCLGDNALALDAGFGSDVRQQLAARGHVISTGPAYLGGAQAVGWDPVRETFFGASDPRKDGAALAF